MFVIKVLQGFRPHMADDGEAAVGHHISDRHLGTITRKKKDCMVRPTAPAQLLSTSFYLPLSVPFLPASFAQRSHSLTHPPTH